MKTLMLVFLLAGAALFAEDAAVSYRAKADFSLTADPAAAHWAAVPAVEFEHGRYGEAIPGYRTQVRSRWTPKNLYFLFTCPYEALFTKPGEPGQGETNELWKWDAAEIFIGSDFENIRRYKEFEVSPRGEWIDLSVELAAGGGGGPRVPRQFLPHPGQAAQVSGVAACEPELVPPAGGFRETGAGRRALTGSPTGGAGPGTLTI